mmetsp:Transcript_32189/g.50370  ORF Transcript_32189/g.50370 Transcript_32189/m.50370 type:complete len:86 (+) Transcript_32189:47-304(+)
MVTPGKLHFVKIEFGGGVMWNIMYCGSYFGLLQTLHICGALFLFFLFGSPPSLSPSSSLVLGEMQLQSIFILYVEVSASKYVTLT